jgi:hypothetical protein
MNSGMGFPYRIINLGFVLLCPTSDNEMTKKKRFTFENLDIFKCTKDYPIIIQGEI